MHAPIGVFDSGIGGLSILQALRAELPSENFVYVADSGHAPYGERDPAHVIERSRTITRYLRDQHQIKALVIACNTATAAAIHLLRQEEPDLPIIGVEPALKPAILCSQTRRIGVMATQGTLSSAKFQVLLASLKDQAEFICQPCSGLASAIEIGDADKIQSLSQHYTLAIGPFADQREGNSKGKVDTLVLGCTHYPFARNVLQDLVGSNVTLLDSGAPVARQTRRVLEAQAMLTPERESNILLGSTGDIETLQIAAYRWLKLDTTARSLLI
jgi:glutamate racemase